MPGSLLPTTSPAFRSGDFSPADVVRLADGHDVFRGISKGRVPLHGVMGRLMLRHGPADLYFATWVNSGASIPQFMPWLEANATRGLVVAFRPGAVEMAKHFGARIQARWGSRALRAAEVHTEIALAIGDGWCATFRGSQRCEDETHKFEWFEMDLRPAVAEFHRRWFDGMAQFHRLSVEREADQRTLAELVRGFR